MYIFLLTTTLVFNLAYCRDFYIGMFKKNDILMAQDLLYKERLPYGRIYAKYGRQFTCPITYIRVVDRLGIGSGPRVEVIRGGLRNKLVVLRLTSQYNYPISVNIYVGCENKIKSTSTTAVTTVKDEPTTSGDGKVTDDGTKGTTVGGTDDGASDATTPTGGATDATTTAPAE